MPMATRVDEASQVEQYSICQRPTLHGTEPCIFEVKNTGPSPEFYHCTQLPNSSQCDTTWADFQACHSEAKNPEGASDAHGGWRTLHFFMIAFRFPSGRRHPGVRVFRGSISWPVLSPVNASTPLLRVMPHDSGPVWFATPSPYDSFIHYTSLVCPAHGRAPSRVTMNRRA